MNVLIDGVNRLADVIRAPMPHTVARLELGGRRPVLWLDTGSPDEDLAWALLDALAALAIGPEHAHAARYVRRLHSVG